MVLQYLEKIYTVKFVESVPKKTRENNKWAVKLWKDWSMHRNTIPDTYAENPSFFPVPVEISMASIENLQFWMPRFINEIRRKDGTDYSPNTLTNIAAGIQRYLREKCNRPAINFLKKMIQHLICSEKAWTLE